MTNLNSCITVGEVHFGGTWGHATAHSVFVGDERQSCDLCSWRCWPGELLICRAKILHLQSLLFLSWFQQLQMVHFVNILSKLTSAVCSGPDGQPLERHWCVWKSSFGRHWRSPHKRGPTADPIYNLIAFCILTLKCYILKALSQFRIW